MLWGRRPALIQCPICGAAMLIELRSKKPNKNLGQVFFKCPRNAHWVRARCLYYRWQRDYYNELVRAKMITVCGEVAQGSGRFLFEEGEAIGEAGLSTEEGSGRTILPGITLAPRPRDDIVEGAKDALIQRILQGFVQGKDEGKELEARLDKMMWGLNVLLVLVVAFVGVAVGYMWK